MDIMTQKDRKMLQEHIDKMVNEFINESILVEKDKDKKKKKKTKKTKGDKESDKEKRISGKNTKAASRRARIIRWLKDDSVNCAEIMRKLWKPSPKKEDSARSYFYKCRDGALNDSGVAYSFSDGEINRLYAIKSGLL